jgi:putative transposase
MNKIFTQTRTATTRNSYHTSLKLAYKLGVIDNKTMDSIPKSTRHRFRNSDYSNVIGIEHSRTLEDNIELVREVFNSRVILASLRATITLKNAVISCVGVKSAFTRMKTVVDAIDSVRDCISLKDACAEFSISPATFHSWKHQVSHWCYDSYIGKCVKRWPNQLRASTIEKIKEIMEMPLVKHWPVSSIAYFASREGLLHLSLQTWYKYVSLCGLSRRLIKKLRYAVGIRASAPDEIWHIDVMLYKTLDGVTSYIYFVVDNFSRCILSWRVAPVLSAAIRTETIREAVEKRIALKGYSGPDTAIIADGGPENCNRTIDDYIAHAPVPLSKLIAGIDVMFSNSIVEAVNKIFRYRHLIPEKIANYSYLEQHLEKSVNEYCTIRPHASIGGLTPFEGYTGVTLDRTEYRRMVAAEMRRRVEENRKTGCTVCA